MPRKSKTTFTETSLAKLRAAAGERETVHFAAGADRHLGIRFRNKRATFFCWFRTAGRVRRLYLGDWPGLSLDKARKAVAVYSGRVALDLDPLEERRQKRQQGQAARKATKDATTATVETRFKQFLEAKRAEELRTASEYESTFRLHVLPAWRKRLVAEIARRDVEILLDKIAERHGVKLADRVLRYLQPFLLW